VLAHFNRYPEAVHAYQQALAQRPSWQEARDNLELIQSLIPKAKKKKTEVPPNLPPDEIKSDEKGKNGKRSKTQQAKSRPGKDGRHLDA